FPPIEDGTLSGPVGPEPRAHSSSERGQLPGGPTPVPPPPADDEPWLSELVKDDTLKENLTDFQCRLGHANRNKFNPSSSDWERTARQMEELFQRLHKGKGRYPLGEELLAVINSEVYRGLKKFSWGWLCAWYRDEEGDRRCRLDDFGVALLVAMDTTDEARATSATRRKS